ncbi:epimerase family protein SDR39U1 [Grus japonensis]|uniref:Epimerase family protein SDR39U1 n=1 Tax=Grus japonensis TaxID=30415 RepID=A0ABC9WI22_GRUJA
MPASSKTDPPLAKVEPISTSVITYLRRGKKASGQLLQPERGMRRCERNSSADPKVSAEGGGGGAPGTRAEIPLQPVEKTMVRQAVHLQPMEVDGGADIHLQPMKVDGGADIHLQPMEDPMLEQVEASEGGYDPVGSPCWSRLLAIPVEREVCAKAGSW